MALERAVEDGRLVPGGRAWRARQRKILEEWLHAPAPELRGAVPVDAVHAERQEDWLANGTRARAAALRSALDVVEPSPDPPAPLQALLDAAVEPIPLTAAHRVPPRIVGPIAERFGWTFPGMPGRNEVHIPEFLTLREFVADARLLARRGRTLRLTPTGRAAQADPAVLAATAADAWFGRDEFLTAVAEVAAAVLLHGPAPAEKIVDVGVATVAPSFRRPDGRHPDRADVRDVAYAWIRPGMALGWVASSSDGYTLTESGRRAASAGLRARARAPRHRSD
ncbi:hypothetical protein [Pseudonocardia nigra]|uniref:hypothetical protein n=1 Tax=Pseudonocardia nigra TaxID=1921578 RepID=UPI001C5D83D5|nr:hypothetical protein [Pseudonocardia nigra]